MEDFYLEPDRIRRVLDMILEFKLAQFDELARRCGRAVDGVLLRYDGHPFTPQSILDELSV